MGGPCPGGTQSSRGPSGRELGLQWWHPLCPSPCCLLHSTFHLWAQGHLTSSLALLGARSLSGTPPGGTAFSFPMRCALTCATSRECSLPGSEAPRGRPCGMARGCAGHPGLWSISREQQERLFLPCCPAPEIRHCPRSSPCLRDVGFFHTVAPRALLVRALKTLHCHRN